MAEIMTDDDEAGLPAVVHPTAEIEQGVFLGDGTRVWRGAHIRAGARIGRGCNIGANVFIDKGVQVGHRVKVQNNVSVYEGVLLEDDVFVGPASVFTNDLNPRAFGDWVLTPTPIRRGASLGANSTIVCGNEVGEFGLVGAGAVVTRPVAAHQLVLGNPARPAGWVCRCGEVISRNPAPLAGRDWSHCPHATP
jgi:acetyltransferase-like isoleucine patch superfamily enzyme